MKLLRRLFFVVMATLLLLAVATPVGLLFAARAVERTLDSERRIGSLVVHVHAPVVSGLLSIKADSVTVRSGESRLSATGFSIQLADWFNRRPATSSILQVQADSIFVHLVAEPLGDETPVFPAGVRFPVTTVFDWRVLEARQGDALLLRAEDGRWRSRGMRGMEGGIARLQWPEGFAPDRKNFMLEAESVWRGPALRYRVSLRTGTGDSAHISGIRDKKDLRQGFDSLDVFLASPASWIPEAFGLEEVGVSEASVQGRVDWRNRDFLFSAGFLTGDVLMAEALRWRVDGQTSPEGGRMDVRAEGLRQSMRASGSWSHPGSWPLPPDWTEWSGTFAADVRGGEWNLMDRWMLPLDFEITDGRLEEGGRVSALVTTRDQSHVSVRWQGDRPGRFDLDGDVSPSETWAHVWTEGNIAYSAAHAEGRWEDGVLRVFARIRDPRAYGAYADSLETLQEISSRAYTLLSAAIHESGETFTGDGIVYWFDAEGESDIGLRFEARHPHHGQARFSMSFPGLEMRGSAEDLRFMRFPYGPLAHLPGIDPRLSGDFRWHLEEGTGEADLRADGVHAGNHIAVSARGDWIADSLRVRQADLETGESRLSGEGSFPFDGRTFGGLGRVQAVTGGSWALRAEGLRIGDVEAVSGTALHAVRGLVDGILEYSPSQGVTGHVEVDSLGMAFPEDHLRIPALTIEGMGDSLRIVAPTVSRRHAALNDTLLAVLTRIHSGSPDFRIQAFASNGFGAHATGSIPGWRRLEGAAGISGNFSLDALGDLLGVDVTARFHIDPESGWQRGIVVDSGLFAFGHASVADTQHVTGSFGVSGGVLRVPSAHVVARDGSRADARMQLSLSPPSMRADLEGAAWNISLADGRRMASGPFEGTLLWDASRGMQISASSDSGEFALPPSPYRVEGGYRDLEVELMIPPVAQTGGMSRAVVRGTLHDFLFQRRIGLRDVTAFFTAFNRPQAPARPVAPGTSYRARPWELDIQVETGGTRNRVDTDVLRMHFMGDVHVTGIYPYTLVRGRVTGLQGELGQSRQAYALRDFEVQWDNVPIEEGVLSVAGEKRLRIDCRPDTRQTCMIFVNLDGTLKNANFMYDTDCGQTTGEQVAPVVLINSMAQGCYVGEMQGGDGGYGAALALLEPAINERLSRGFARGSAGFIQSSQVTGLGALVGADSVSLESISLEVESREVYRVGFKGRAGYHPEAKLSNPMEYRLAAEFRPPVENWFEQSVWSDRLRDRLTMEAAVETRPEGRGIEEERRVRQRAGVRYRYRFWSLW